MQVETFASHPTQMFVFGKGIYLKTWLLAAPKRPKLGTAKHTNSDNLNKLLILLFNISKTKQGQF